MEYTLEVRLKLGQMGRQEAPQCSNEASPLNTTLVLPFEAIHGVFGLENLYENEPRIPHIVMDIFAYLFGYRV